MIKRELSIFLIVGALSVLVDFISYHGLVELKLMEVDIAKASGFLAGTLFSYFANSFWTFGHISERMGSAWRFSALYASTLCVNVLFNALALKLLLDVPAAFQLAFLLATVVSACLNFMGMKFLVFKPIQTPEA
jgi:putative flippase GtrA